MADEYALMRKHVEAGRSGWVSELGDVNVERLSAMSGAVMEIIECLKGIAGRQEVILKRLSGLEGKVALIGPSSGRKTKRQDSKTSSSPSASPGRKKKPLVESLID